MTGVQTCALPIYKVDCFKTFATKFNHVTGEFMDTDLNTRFVNINGNEIQRDLHSAFNLKYISINLHSGANNPFVY